MCRQAIVSLLVCALCVAGCLAPSRAAVSCTISATAVRFGNYNVFKGTATNSNGSVTYNCAGFPLPLGSGPVTIFLGKGASPTFTPRFMRSGVNNLNYNLFLDAGLTQIWGNGTGGTSFYSATAVNGARVTVTVFGSVPAGQDARVGAYTDTIRATINF